MIRMLVALASLGLSPAAFCCDKALTPSELDAIAQRIFLNECNAQRACLVDWNAGESFPSLGIGHFIWYPQGVNPGFVESFPLLMDYLQQQAIALPAWLTRLRPFAAPWPDRAHFQEQRNSPQVDELRTFLLQNQALQIAFMQQRMRLSLQHIRTRLAPAQRQPVQLNIEHLCQSPAGQYALIDYVNFKGEGLAEGERLQGQGWGLMQVLSQMPATASAVEAINQFVLSADRVLTQRADRSANPDMQKHWLPGWRKRIQTYLDFNPS